MAGLEAVAAKQAFVPIGAGERRLRVLGDDPPIGGIRENVGSAARSAGLFEKHPA